MVNWVHGKEIPVANERRIATLVLWLMRFHKEELAVAIVLQQVDMHGSRGPLISWLLFVMYAALEGDQES